jgi:hypothetical protein
MTAHAPARWYGVTLTTNRMIDESVIQGSYADAASLLTRLLDQARARGDEVRAYAINEVEDPGGLLWGS